MHNIEWVCPKVDSHCHFGGMITPQTVYNIAHSQLHMSLESIHSAMVCTKNGNFEEFLEKFKILDKIDWNPTLMVATIADVCDNLRSHDIHHISISLSLNKYISDEMSIVQAAELIQRYFQLFADAFNIEYRLLLSMKYEAPTGIQRLIFHEIEDSHVFGGFAGIDLVGKEECVNAEFYAPYFQRWKEAGKTLRAHVGELPGTADNVRIAIDELGVDRIAHGIYADDECLQTAADRGIVFDLALCSNMKTGAVLDMKNHPIRRMLDQGCLVTLNTDDPVQFGCSIDDEFALALAYNLIDIDQANHIMHTAYNLTHHQ